MWAVQAAAGAPAGGELPDAWELLYSAALMLARSAAVDELLGDTQKCILDYSRCEPPACMAASCIDMGFALPLPVRALSHNREHPEAYPDLLLTRLCQCDLVL